VIDALGKLLTSLGAQFLPGSGTGVVHSLSAEPGEMPQWPGISGAAIVRVGFVAGCMGSAQDRKGIVP
jgi:hypothetical protein